MSKRARRETGGPSRKSRPASFIDPRSEFGIAWRQAFWAGDPLLGLADGASVSSWRASGSSWGAYTNTGAGLNLPGTTGNYASAPDSAALDITTDLALVCKVSLTDWTPAAEMALIGKYVTTGNQRSYYLSVSATTGKLGVYWASDGTAGTLTSIVSTVAPTVADGASLWVAATLDTDNGGGNSSATFWTSTDGVTWTQLGATATGVKQDIYSGTGILTIGCDGNLSRMVNGAISVARIYNGSGFSASGPSGTLVFDADFRRDDCSSFTASTGQAVTINSTFNAVQATAGSQPTFRASTAAFNGHPTIQFDGGDYLASGAGAAQSQPISVVVIGQATTLGGAGAVSLFCDGISAARMALGYYQTGSKVRVIGTAALDLNGADTNPHLLTGLLNGASSAATKDGTSLGTGTTSTAVTPTGMTIGASYLAANFVTGHIAFVGWYVGDITAHANWTRFKAWVREHYGITVA